MDKKQELLQVIQENPGRELIVMYSSEGNSDYAYSLGSILKIQVTESTVIDERVYLSDEYDELFETIGEDIYFEKYRNTKRLLTDEENAEIDNLTKEEIEKLEWKPVIVVYVG